MWMVQTGERAPFWCALLVFTRADGKCFIPPVVVNQAKDYSQCIHNNIPLDWTVHHTPSGYMDRYGWRKATTQFSNICGASPVNNQILLFSGHDSHFDDCYLKKCKGKNSSPSYLKQVTPSTTSPMITGLTQNWSLSASFWRLSGCWSMGTTRFQPHRMNSVLVETWEAFHGISWKHPKWRLS